MMKNIFNQKIKVTSLTFLLLLLGTFISTTSYGQTLKGIADQKNVFIGTIMSNSFINNTNLDNGNPNRIIRSEFNAIVLENAMKMNAVINRRPSNPFNFGPEALNTNAIDFFIRYSKRDVPSDPLYTRGHTLIWHSQAPAWLEQESRNWSRQQIYDFTFQYIRAMVSYTGNDIDEWDVINEVLQEGNGPQIGGFRADAWWSRAGTTRAELDDYFNFCFETAKQFAPNAKLFYNDFNIEAFNTGSGSKNRRMREFAQKLVNLNTPIDGIGFQSHFVLSQIASGSRANFNFINSIQTSMENLDDIGLEVAITELDIRRCQGNTVSNEGHRAAYEAFTNMAYMQPNCNLVLVWAISDKDSWVIPFFGCDFPVLFDDNYNKKGAYFGVTETLDGLTTNSTPVVDDIINVIAPTSVTRGEEITIEVNYVSSERRDILVLFQLGMEPWTVYTSETITVDGGSGSVNVQLTIPEDVPVLEQSFQIQTFISPVNTGFDERLDEEPITGISVTEADNIISVSAPSSVSQGEEITVEVDYFSSERRDILVLFQLGMEPWTVYTTETITVNGGSGTIDVLLTIPEDVPPLERSFQIQTSISPVNTGFDERLDNERLTNISVTERVVIQQAPFNGVPTSLPGTLELENYDIGGAGLSYNDSDVTNNGADRANFRTDEEVDIGLGNNGFILGWTADGEWTEYTIDVESAAVYDMDIVYSSLNGGGELSLELDGNTILTGVELPSTGDWGVYSTLQETISLPEGIHVLRVNIVNNGFNLDRFVVTAPVVTGVNDDETSSITVFPNPSETGIFQLSREQNYQVYSITGTLLIEDNSSTVDLSTYSEGTYILKFNNTVTRLVR